MNLENKIYTLLTHSSPNMNMKDISQYIARGIEMERLNMPVVLDNGAYMPTKAYPTDAGFDLRMPDNAECTLIRPHSSLTVDTGVHMAIPAGYVGMIKSKSGLNVKYGLRCEGVVDSGYTGSIVVKIYNDTGSFVDFRTGDKIAQLVILPIPKATLTQVDVLADTDRGDGGFGSTGR